MIKSLSLKCTRFLIMKGKIPPDKEPILCYGFELVIITVIGNLILAAISLVYSQPLAWLCFLLGFAPLRSTAGGYHASSHIRCYLTTAGMFISGLCFALSIDWDSIVYLIIAFISTGLILVMSPVEANNKKLTKEQRKRNRRKSIATILIEFTLSSILYIFDISNAEICIFFTGIASASISLIMAKIANRRNSKSSPILQHDS